MTLRAVVVGTGWAGEGHTLALRAAGVEVVALCGRTPEPAKAMANKLGIDDVRFDWQQAIQSIRPEIVSIATPAAPHREIVEVAAGVGCHIMCDKPLGVTSEEARTMLSAVERAGVKHAYGSTSRYAPSAVYARQLVADGLIGQIREIESTFYASLSPLLPYSWFYSLALGGGMLNNVLTHKLGQVLFITGGAVTSAAGDARCLLERAPVGAPIHDFRTLFGELVQPDDTTQWRTVDADLAYTVLTQIKLPDSTQASGVFRSSGMAKARNRDYLVFYGENGTLHLSGSSMMPDHIEHFDAVSGEWQELSVPPEIIASLPQHDSAVQRDWNQLFHEFVVDIKGGEDAGYPTFYDGWLHNEIIDIVRSGQSWTAIPAWQTFPRHTRVT